jgi:hypothetical protein
MNEHAEVVLKERPRQGTLWELLLAEHARLDGLLTRAAEISGELSVETYAAFREALLRHIRVEEKILLPMAQRKRDGVPLPLTARLRLDHGALAALLMLPPQAQTFHALRTILDVHNPLEEGEGGVYTQCEALAGAESNEIKEQVAKSTRVPVSSWVDSPMVVAAAQRVLVRAGYSAALLGL